MTALKELRWLIPMVELLSFCRMKEGFLQTMDLPSYNGPLILVLVKIATLLKDSLFNVPLEKPHGMFQD
jgi:hypothetical protein